MKELKTLPEVLRAFANYVEGNGLMVQVQYHPGLNDNWYELKIQSSNYLHLSKRNRYRLKSEKIMIPWTPEVAVKYLKKYLYKSDMGAKWKVLSIEINGIKCLRNNCLTFFSYRDVLNKMEFEGTICGTEVEE